MLDALKYDLGLSDLRDFRLERGQSARFRDHEGRRQEVTGDGQLESFVTDDFHTAEASYPEVPDDRAFKASQHGVLGGVDQLAEFARKHQKEILALAQEPTGERQVEVPWSKETWTLSRAGHEKGSFGGLTGSVEVDYARVALLPPCYFGPSTSSVEYTGVANSGNIFVPLQLDVSGAVSERSLKDVARRSGMRVDERGGYRLASVLLEVRGRTPHAVQSIGTRLSVETGALESCTEFLLYSRPALP